MPLTVTHSKVSAIPDDPAAVAAGEVVPSDWNADHAIVGAAEFDQATKSSSVPASPYNISSADHGKVIKFRDTGTGSYLTAVLPSRASVTDGFYVWLVSNTSSASEYVKLSPNAGDGLNGTAGDIDIYDEGSALVIADANLSNNWLVLANNRSLPAQSGNNGKLLTTDGTNASWSAALTSSSTSPTLTLTQTGTGPVLLLEDTTSPDATPTTFDTNGNLIFSGTARTTTATNAIEFNTLANNISQPRLMLTHWSASQTTDARMLMRHFPSGTIGTYAVNASGDELGSITWIAYSSVSPTLTGSLAANISATAQSSSTAKLTLYSTAGLTIASTSGSYTMPMSDGTANQVLRTNGAGVLSWQTISGGGGSSAGSDIYLANFFGGL